jgi:hypothetical protein
MRVGAGPLFCDLCLLPADLGFQVLVDRHGRFATHLVVHIPKLGGALSVVDQAPEVQTGRIRCA